MEETTKLMIEYAEWMSLEDFTKTFGNTEKIVSFWKSINNEQD